MDRRSFVSRLGSVVTATAISGKWSFVLTGCSGSSSGGTNDIPDGLASQLLHFADSHFSQYAEQYSSNDLYHALLDKGVVSDTGLFFEEGVAAVAPIDPIVEYNSFFYTKSELQLYALAFQLSVS